MNLRVHGVAVRLDVVLGCLLRMLAGVDVMPVSQMRMMRGCFVISVRVMPGGFAVVARSVLVMLGCLLVMVCCFM